MTYSGEEVEYFYFVQSMNIVGRILMYKQGCKLFPIQIRGYDGRVHLIHQLSMIPYYTVIPHYNSNRKILDEITVTKLVSSIAQLVTNQAGYSSGNRNITGKNYISRSSTTEGCHNTVITCNADAPIAARYDSSILATDILKKLCSSEATYQQCLCRDAITDILLAPVRQWTDSSHSVPTVHALSLSTQTVC